MTRTGLLRRTGGSRPSYRAQFKSLRSKALINKLQPDSVTLAAFSWRERVSSEVTDQGKCSTCWIFSAVGAFEAAYAGTHNARVVKLSEERVFDCVSAANCDHEDDPSTAFRQLASKGTVTAAEDPYIPDKSGCDAARGRYFAAPEAQYIGDDPDPDLLKRALMAFGPITVSLLANDAFKSWHSPGAFGACDGNGDLHYVLLVGWNEQGWLIKNSWQDWGEDGSGFGWVRYGCNGIGKYAMAILAR